MKAIVIQLLKSFWLVKIKLLLCLVAATLSAWGISTLLYGYFLTDRDFQQNFDQSNPAGLILLIEKPTAAFLEKVKELPGVVDIERREAVGGRIKSSGGSWMPITLYGAELVRETRISKFSIESENTPSNSVFIEKSGVGLLTQSIDSIELELNGKVLKHPFGGLAHDAGQAPSQMEQAFYGYTSLDYLQPYLQTERQRYLVSVEPEVLNLDDLEKLKREINAWASENFKVTVVIPPPGEHPHQGIVDAISFLQLSFGSILSLLGAILLSLILITWLYPQIVSIGVMKAIGASDGMVLKAHILVILIIVNIGLLIGLPLGYKAGLFYSGSVAMIQNFAPSTEMLPVFIHLYVLIPVVLIPLLLVFIPLYRSSKTTVQNALNQVFYTPYQFIFKITQTLRNNKLKYSLNNLFRSNQRTFLLFILLSAGVALFTTGFNLRHSLQKDFAGYAADAGYDITVIFKEPMESKLDYIETLAFVEKAAYISRRGILFGSANQAHGEGTSIRVLPSAYDVNTIRFIRGNLQPDCNTCFYATHHLEHDFDNVPLGSTVEITHIDQSKENLIYSGIIKDISFRGFIQFSSDSISGYRELALKVKGGYNKQKAAGEIDDVLLRNGIDVLTVSNLETRLLALENHLAPMYLVIQAMGAVTLLISLSGLFIVLGLSLRERAREIGIIKTLGGSSRSIVNLYQWEYLVITMLSIALGILFGYFLNGAICQLFGEMVLKVPVPPLINLPAMVIGMLALLAIQFTIVEIYVRDSIAKTSNRLLSQIS